MIKSAEIKLIKKIIVTKKIIFFDKLFTIFLLDITQKVFINIVNENKKLFFSKNLFFKN